MQGTTNPNISFAVDELLKFTSNTSNIHWKVMITVLGYLKKIKYMYIL